MTVHSSRCRRRSAPEGDMSLQRFGRRGDAREDALHDLIGADLIGERLEREHDAVPDDVEREVLKVLAGDVAAAAQKGEGAAGEDEVDRGSRTGPVAHVLRELAETVITRLSRSRRDAHDVLHVRGVDVYIVHLTRLALAA